MRKKIKAPEDMVINDQPMAVDKNGNPIKTEDPNFLGTKPIYLSASKPIKAINMFLPPGISMFYVERLDKNHVRFLIRKEEIDRLAMKAEKIIKDAKKGGD